MTCLIHRQRNIAAITYFRQHNTVALKSIEFTKLIYENAKVLYVIFARCIPLKCSGDYFHSKCGVVRISCIGIILMEIKIFYCHKVFYVSQLCRRVF